MQVATDTQNEQKQKQARHERQAEAIEELTSEGRYLTPKLYSAITGIPEQTLTNWRYKDRRGGLKRAPAGFPEYKYFGPSVRYWLAARRAGAA